MGINVIRHTEKAPFGKNRLTARKMERSNDSRQDSGYEDNDGAITSQEASKTPSPDLKSRAPEPSRFSFNWRINDKCQVKETRTPSGKTSEREIVRSTCCDLGCAGFCGVEQLVWNLFNKLSCCCAPET